MGWCPTAWRSEPALPKFAPDPEPSLANFAWQSTPDVLEVEPVLALLIDLVTGRYLTPLGWAQVDRIAAMFVGPTRGPVLSRPSTGISPQFRSALYGETTLKRYCAALRQLARQDGEVSEGGASRREVAS